MPLICYQDKAFRGSSLEIIRHANAILEEYGAQGYDLTLRQLYYQFVARDLLPNTQRSYKRLGSIVSEARMAGRIDWSYIVDRTRNLRRLATWSAPADIIAAAADSFRKNLWAAQPVYLEAWIEKDALVGVLEAACNKWRVPYFSCRGYTSQSTMWAAAKRLAAQAAHKDVRILHLGDHDPSGIDMSRDIADRLAIFGADVDVRRIALNMNQVKAFSPPPNPAKITDSRASGYIARFGDQSWELDALSPQTIGELIDNEVGVVLRMPLWRALEKKEQECRELLNDCAARWDDVADFLQDNTIGDE